MTVDRKQRTAKGPAAGRPHSSRRPGTWAIMALLAVAGFGLLGVGASPTDGTPLAGTMPDLEVEAVRLPDRPEVSPEWHDGIPGQATYDVEVAVINNGDAPAPYSLTPYWRGVDGQLMPLNGGDGFASEPGPVQAPLRGDESRTHELAWILQPGQVGLGQVVVELTILGPLSDENADNNVNETSVFVKDRVVGFEAAGEGMKIAPNATGFLRFALRNSGNVVENVLVTIFEAPTDARLTASLDDDLVQIEPGQQIPVTLYVEYRPGANFQPLSVTYIVHANPGFGNPLEAKSKVLENGPRTSPREVQAFKAEHIATGPVAATTTGEGLTNIRISNTGFAPDNYTLSVAQNPRWSATIEPNRVALYPGENTTATVRVKPHHLELAGNASNVQILVKGSLLEQALPVNIPVAVGGPAPDLALEFSDDKMYRGDTPTVEATIENVGTEKELGGAITLSVSGSGTIPEIIRRFYGPLESGESQSVRFVLKPSGGGILSVNATLVSASGRIVGPVPLVTVVHKPAMEIQAPTPLTGSAGQKLEYNGNHAFTVKNTGNAPEIVLVRVFGTPGRVTVNGTTAFGLNVSESRSVALTQVIPRPSEGITHLNATMTVGIAGATDSWTMSVRSVVLDAQAPTLRLAPLPPATVKVNSTIPLVVLATDNDAVKRINATSIDPTGAKVSIPFTKGLNDQWFANITVGHLGKTLVTVKAHDLRNNTSPPVEASITASKGLPPSLRLEGYKGGAIGPMTPLRVIVEDDFGVAKLNATFTQFGNSTQRDLTLVGKQATFNLTGFESGDVKVLLVAKNIIGGTSRLAATFTLVDDNATSFDTSGSRSGFNIPMVGVLPIPLLAAIAWRWHTRRKS